MANEVAEKNEVVYLAGNEEVKLKPSTVRDFLTSGNGNITSQEAFMFIKLCEYQHLNPFLNEAYLIKFGNKPAQIITSKEAFMKRAESHPAYNGVKAGLIVLRNSDVKYTKGAFKLPTDKILGAWAEVNRKDRDEPHHIEISMEEFSKQQSTWKSMPATMIRKTAIVNALREAFPETLGGMYTEDDKNPNEAVKESEPVDDKAESVVDDLVKDIKPKNEPAEKEGEPKESEQYEEQETTFEEVNSKEAEKDGDSNSEEQTSLFKGATIQPNV
ncbi:phage recombination protein Bet [Liquorilactobacillus capillatus]|uniref:Phage recombination protein Bet n=1 Tax=Liquorilactobacillus capillatus DSM 19910 TaxID=1423731 RepID=A0A0R1MB97_9LACO|nr:phage recombination protein Bet [Liquorilactobacillus capillatus]KRL02501.1 phage recombination protein Bet [Liquorilactobacillus capillatus DSM 19910]